MAASISVTVVAAVSLVIILAVFYRVKEERADYTLTVSAQRTVSELGILTNEYLLHRTQRAEEQWLAKYHQGDELFGNLDPNHGHIFQEYRQLGSIFGDTIANNKELAELRLERARIEEANKLYVEETDITEGFARISEIEEHINVGTALEERLVVDLIFTSHAILTEAAEVQRRTREA